MLWLSMQLEYVVEQLVRTINRFSAVKSTAEILFELAAVGLAVNWQTTSAWLFLTSSEVRKVCTLLEVSPLIILDNPGRLCSQGKTHVTFDMF